MSCLAATGRQRGAARRHRRGAGRLGRSSQAPQRRGGPCTAAARAKRFRDRIATIRDLDAAIGLLGWDEETYLPALGHAQRGEQFATLESLRHKLLLEPELYAVAIELTESQPDDALLARELALYFRLQRARTRCRTRW